MLSRISISALQRLQRIFVFALCLGSARSVSCEETEYVKEVKQLIRWLPAETECLIVLKGDPFGQDGLGYMYAIGLGVERDLKQAVQWYRKAADQGYSSAQFHLGLMYAHGLGVEKDEKKAIEWYRKAAKNSDVTVSKLARAKLKELGASP